ncbi:type VII secretion system-associated protein [Streptomyces albus]
MVDPTWQGEGPPPAWALVGQWRSSPEGEIVVVEWQDNEEYQPSPKALGWPEPADDVDAAVQLAATGYGPGEDVTKALAALDEVAVFVTPNGDPLPATAPDGETAVVPVFTSPVYLHTSGRLAFALHPVRKVLEQLPEGHLIYLNPSAPVSMTVETEALREALGDTELTGSEDEAAEGEGRDKVPAVVGKGIPVLGRPGPGSRGRRRRRRRRSPPRRRSRPARRRRPRRPGRRTPTARAAGRRPAAGPVPTTRPQRRAELRSSPDGGAASTSCTRPRPAPHGRVRAGQQPARTPAPPRVRSVRPVPAPVRPAARPTDPRSARPDGRPGPPPLTHAHPTCGDSHHGNVPQRPRFHPGRGLRHRPRRTSRKIPRSARPPQAAPPTRLPSPRPPRPRSRRRARNSPPTPLTRRAPRRTPSRLPLPRTGRPVRRKQPGRPKQRYPKQPEQPRQPKPPPVPARTARGPLRKRRRRPSRTGLPPRGARRRRTAGRTAGRTGPLTGPSRNPSKGPSPGPRSRSRSNSSCSVVRRGSRNRRRTSWRPPRSPPTTG